jgi:malonyl CoA-acyl carrier protein transacylase
MGRELVEKIEVAKDIFDRADKVMSRILGEKLTDIIFCNEPIGSETYNRQQEKLKQTAITQPAILALNVAITKVLDQLGLKASAVLGHSLGEYAACVEAGVFSFEDALLAVAARGSEMTAVSLEDTGKMATVFAAHEKTAEVLKEVDGYVICANLNSQKQTVISGASKAVHQAVDLFNERGIKSFEIPVSHAFHSKIVAAASEPLKRVLRNLEIGKPQIPVVSNVRSMVYPTDDNYKETIVDILGEQIYSPVEFVGNIQKMYELGVRVFVEIGPGWTLSKFVDDILEGKEIAAVYTNHRKKGEIEILGDVLSELTTLGVRHSWVPKVKEKVASTYDMQMSPIVSKTPPPSFSTFVEDNLNSVREYSQKLAQTYFQKYPGETSPSPRHIKIVFSGVSVGLPGKSRQVFDETNIDRILAGENFIDEIAPLERKKQIGKEIKRLVKGGQSSFQKISKDEDTIKLAGQLGQLDVIGDYGVDSKLVATWDLTTKLAVGAGLEALRDAGIPLVHHYEGGKFLWKKASIM